MYPHLSVNVDWVALCNLTPNPGRDATNGATPAALPTAVQQQQRFTFKYPCLNQSAEDVIVSRSRFPIAYLTHCITSIADEVNTASLSGTN